MLALKRIRFSPLLPMPMSSLSASPPICTPKSVIVSSARTASAFAFAGAGCSSASSRTPLESFTVSRSALASNDTMVRP
jgi:hypothetical protein